jgi:hypothetical protein
MKATLVNHGFVNLNRSIRNVKPAVDYKTFVTLFRNEMAARLHRWPEWHTKEAWKGTATQKASRIKICCREALKFLARAIILLLLQKSSFLEMIYFWTLLGNSLEWRCPLAVLTSSFARSNWAVGMPDRQRKTSWLRAKNITQVNCWAMSRKV